MKDCVKKQVFEKESEIYTKQKNDNIKSFLKKYKSQAPGNKLFF